MINKNTLHSERYVVSRNHRLVTCSFSGFVKPPKNWGINKWRIFINASNRHLKISLILLNVVSFYNLCNFFADKCLKMKLLIDICTIDRIWITIFPCRLCVVRVILFMKCLMVVSNHQLNNFSWIACSCCDNMTNLSERWWKIGGI